MPELAVADWQAALLIVIPFVVGWCCCLCCSELQGDHDEPCVVEVCCVSAARACDIFCVPGCLTNPLTGLWEFAMRRGAPRSQDGRVFTSV